MFYIYQCPGQSSVPDSGECTAKVLLYPEEGKTLLYGRKLVKVSVLDRIIPFPPKMFMS